MRDSITIIHQLNVGQKKENDFHIAIIKRSVNHDIIKQVTWYCMSVTNSGSFC